jgi:hypothetical protein
VVNVRIRCAGWALLFCLVQNAPARDWKQYPAIVQIDTNTDIFAVGDVHGDYDRLVKLLAAARIIEPPGSPEMVTWIADKSVLVFTGDLIDKGPRCVEVLRLVRSLRDAAARQGGQVVILMGNHEAEFLADPTANKTKDFADDLRRAGIVPQETAACGGDLGQFLCSLPFGARVRDWFFSHGGNTGGRSMEQLGSNLQDAVEKEGFGTQQLVGGNSLLEARLGEEGPNGRSWFDIESPKRTEEQLLASYARALGVAHFVQGHQHQKVLFEDGQQRNAGEMFQWRGLLFLIDVGMSEGVGASHGAVLRIHTGNRPEAVAICANGKQTSIWDDAHIAKTSRARGCGPAE